METSFLVRFVHLMFLKCSFSWALLNITTHKDEYHPYIHDNTIVNTTTTKAEL